MSVSTRTILIPALGAGAVPAFVAVPPSGSGPGILLCQEIFGVNDYIRDRATRLASLGYVTVAPQLYRRFGRDIAIDEADDDALDRGLEYRQRLDFAGAIDDAVAAFEHMREMPDAYRRIGVLGFCLGAGIAFGVAARTSPAAAVLYYGSDIPAQLDHAPDVRCPLLFHWGGDDDYVPETARDAVAKAFSGRDVETYLYPGAGHAFDNDRSPVFSRPRQAAEAWRRTEAFLARTLPVAHH